MDEDGHGEITEQEMINVLRKQRQSGDEQSFANLATEYSLGDTELASQYLLIR